MKRRLPNGNISILPDALTPLERNLLIALAITAIFWVIL